MKTKQMPAVGIETVESAREIVAYLGGDPLIIGDYWCYPELKEAFPELKAAYFDLIEKATTGDVARAACRAGMFLDMPKERAFYAIENATAGEVSRYAYVAGMHLNMPKERVFAVIEKATTGEVDRYAYLAIMHLGMPHDRVAAVIERWRNKNKS